MYQHLFAANYDWLTRAVEKDVLAPRRTELLAEVEGDVLDVGAGTGANLAHLTRSARVVAVEPHPAMRSRLARKAADARLRVRVDDAFAEDLPYPDDSFDAVLFTGVLCSVRDPDRALEEARRVLRPDGRLVVLEHVRGEGRLAIWQDRITPIWSRLVPGCHPNRDIRTAVTRAGFAFERMDSFDPLPRLVPARPMLAGLAAVAPS